MFEVAPALHLTTITNEEVKVAVQIRLATNWRRSAMGAAHAMHQELERGRVKELGGSMRVLRIQTCLQQAIGGSTRAATRRTLSSTSCNELRSTWSSRKTSKSSSRADVASPRRGETQCVHELSNALHRRRPRIGFACRVATGVAKYFCGCPRVVAVLSLTGRIVSDGVGPWARA